MASLTIVAVHFWAARVRRPDMTNQISPDQNSPNYSYARQLVSSSCSHDGVVSSQIHSQWWIRPCTVLCTVVTGQCLCAHHTFHSVHSTSHTAHCALYCVHTIHSTVCTVHGTVCSVHCIVCTLYITLWSLCTVLCVHYTFHCVHCELYCVYIIHSTMCTVHCIVCTQSVNQSLGNPSGWLMIFLIFPHWLMDLAR